MSVVYIALGSNLGDRAALLAEAIRRMGAFLRVTALSPIYETDPVDYRDQPRFLNAALAAETDLPPRELLHALQRIEHDLGRERPFPNAPRTIDLDLLFYDGRILDTPELTLPHPRLHERAFVLVPLAAIAPDLAHPRLKRTIRELLDALGETSGVREWRPDA